jgi:hypothetical protein
MAIYAVHIQDSELESLGEAAFVRQAFDWRAFWFGPLWLAWHGLLAGLIAWTAAYAALIAASRSFLSATAAIAIALALQILLGLEAAALREAKLSRQGYRLAEIISAGSRDEAEARFFHELQSPRAAPAGDYFVPPAANS